MAIWIKPIEICVYYLYTSTNYSKKKKKKWGEFEQLQLFFFFHIFWPQEQETIFSIFPPSLKIKENGFFISIKALYKGHRILSTTYTV